MTDFSARTRAQLQGREDAPKNPGESVPTADPEGLRELGATETWPRSLEYAHPRHTLEDLMRPGYFDGDVRERMHVGDQISYTLRGGSKLPSEWERGLCIVEEIPSHKESPLILAGIIEHPQPAAWRTEKEKVA